MYNHCVKYAKYAGVPVRVSGIVLAGEDHYIRMYTGVERVLVTAKIVSRIIDAKDLVAVNPIADKKYRVPLSGTIFSLVTIVLPMTQASK